MNVLGQLGEQITRHYLEEQGYVFVESNYTLPCGEIDLVMKQGEQTVFVEVKTRTAGNQVAPNNELSQSKLNRLEKAALEYVGKRGIDDWRLELVAVTVLDGGLAKVKVVPL